jgi:site-specific recombinase XerD
VSTDVVRRGLTDAVAAHLPGWAGRLTPHVLRHYCASQLYQAGVDIIAVQELLGHSWISTTMRYVNPRELHQAGDNLQVACWEWYGNAGAERPRHAA